MDLSHMYCALWLSRSYDAEIYFVCENKQVNLNLSFNTLFSNLVIKAYCPPVSCAACSECHIHCPFGLGVN